MFIPTREPSSPLPPSAQEVLPSLKFLLCPRLRAVTHHLLTPLEHQTLSATVAIMLDYGVNYCFQEQQQQHTYARPTGGQRQARNMRVGQQQVTLIVSPPSSLL